MADLVIKICDKCGSKKDVSLVQLVRAGKKTKSELCEKCFTDFSVMYKFVSPGRGWSKKEIVDFDSIKRNKDT